MASSGDAPVELRFKNKSSLFGGVTPIAVACTAIAVLAWGGAAWSIWYRGHLGFLAAFGHIFVSVGFAFLGVLFMLGAVYMWILLSYGLVERRRIWRQIRPPGAVVDTSGIRFETRRGLITVPWEDVEQLVPGYVTAEPKPISQLRLCVTPDAEILRETRVRFPADRWLTVAALPDGIDESMDEATRVLRHLSGSRLIVDETKPADES